jgi:hypothetical protein
MPGEATPTLPMEPFRRHSGTPPYGGDLNAGEERAMRARPAAHGPRRAFVLLLLAAVIAAAGWYLFQHLTVTR